MRLLFLALLFPLAALAQDAYPSKPVRMILPFPPGGGTDILGRLIADKLSAALGQPVVAENRGGAGGNVGAEAAAHSAPDGYTLVLVAPSLAISPTLYSKLNYDPVKDLTPISLVAVAPNVIVTQPSMPPTLREFIALVKEKPGAFNYGSSGNGTILHLAVELYLEAAGIKVKHIPYKGVGPMVTDALGGQVDFVAAALPSIQGHIASGKLRPIGLFPAQRTPAAPSIPTFAEQGLANFDVEAWFGVIGPKGMSPAVVKKVHDAVAAAFNDPAVKEAMAKQGNTIRITTTEQAQAAFRVEQAKYAALVKKVGLEPQ